MVAIELTENSYKDNATSQSGDRSPETALHPDWRSLPVVVADRVDEELTELIPRAWGVWKKVNVIVPEKIASQLDEDTRKVIEIANSLPVIEYDSGKPGDLIAVTSGMHGEEAKLVAPVLDLDSHLGRNLRVLKKGKTILMPELNPPGCEDQDNLTRYVFPDEYYTNLNNEFHQFSDGSWAEFLSLPTKTAKLAWLIIDYLKTKSDEHQQKYKKKYKTYLLDLHREEGIPIARFDRMYENESVLERLYHAYARLGIPIVLENAATWAEELADTFSTKACNLGWLAITIEIGRTVKPDPTQEEYVAYQLIKLLEEKGMVDIDRDWKRNARLTFDKILSRPGATLGRTRDFWQHQREAHKVYHLDEVKPRVVFNDSRSSKSFSPAMLLKRGLNQPNWDGIITFDYAYAFLGEKVKRGRVLPLANFSFGERNSQRPFSKLPQSDGQLILSVADEDVWIVSQPEPKNPKDNTYCCFGFFLDKKDHKTIVVKLIGDDYEGERFTRKDVLPPKKIKRLITQGAKVDISALSLQCAKLDPNWEGRVYRKKIGKRRRREFRLFHKRKIVYKV